LKNLGGGAQGFGVGGSFASGGPVRGPGTGTSDSIWARVSNGEFVVRADGSNLGDAIAHFARGYALGGLVAPFASAPRFAGGGAVSTLGHFNVDLRTDWGSVPVQVSQTAAADMRRMAVDRNYARTSRPPSWSR